MYLLALFILMLLVGFLGAKFGNALFYKNNPNTKREQKTNNKRFIIVTFLIAITIFISSPLMVVFTASFTGIHYLNTGKYDEAIAEFNRIIKLDPKFSDSYVLRGRAYLAEGKYDEAILDYSRAIYLKHNSAKAYHGRAVAYFDLKNYDAAWEDIHKGDAFGYKPNKEDLDFFAQLKKASGRNQ